MYMHAPAMHPAMKHVMPVRRALGVRTVFNILGPLTNPAGARRQVMGVYSAHLVPLVGEALAMLGTEHAFVVHGSDGLDELTITGASSVAEVRGNAVSLRQISPGDAGLTPARSQRCAAAMPRRMRRSCAASSPGKRARIAMWCC